MNTQKLVLTYRFRIKGGSAIRRLRVLSRQVNLIWNYCNETSFRAIRNYSHWISHVELDALLSGSSKLTELHSQTIQAISKEYVTRRVQFKKRKLRWRVSSGSKRSLGWIPFKKAGIKVQGSRIKYFGQEFKFWNSWDGKKSNQRDWEKEAIKILNGCFSEDSKGNWYLNLTCEVKPIEMNHLVVEVGADPGIKDAMTFSDGRRIQNQQIYRQCEDKLANAQKRDKKKQVRNIHRKIANKRKDDLHKETTKVVRVYQKIFVGNVSGKFLQQSSGKSSTDASVGIIRQLLNYKAIRHSGRCIEVSEVSSTITCSHCLKKTGPSGLGDLGVREWSCSACGCHHDRDINAASNILRFGRESLKRLEKVA